MSACNHMPDTDNADGIFCRVGQLPPVAGFQNSSAFVGGCVGVIFPGLILQAY